MHYPIYADPLQKYRLYILHDRMYLYKINKFPEVSTGVVRGGSVSSGNELHKAVERDLYFLQIRVTGPDTIWHESVRKRNGAYYVRGRSPVWSVRCAAPLWFGSRYILT